MTSQLPLPSVEGSSEDADDTGYDYKTQLIAATRLNRNWTNPEGPAPRSRTVINTPVAAVWLFQARFLVTLTSGSLACWDLDRGGSSGEIIWGAALQDRPVVYHAAEMNVKGTSGIVLAYTFA